MKYRYLFTILTVMLITSCNQNTLYESENYTVTATKVVQGEFSAEALSATRITSNYRSDYKMPTKREVFFKFSLNGGDNERFPGEDHRLLILGDSQEMTSAIYTFGEADPKEVIRQKISGPVNLDGDVTVTFRCDMRPVLDSFKTKGLFISKTGETIQADEFEGLYIAGSTLPLTWEFAALRSRPEFKMTDADNDGVYEITLTISKYQQAGQSSEPQSVWTLKEDISQFPVYESPQLLVDALYNLSLEELLLDIREDGALMAGKKWPGVWTRDISYSILLSLAAVHPKAAKKSLLAKVKNDRIIQDTGTGGSWPVSTDRMTWALAAWEVYKVTADPDWLKQAYTIIKNSAADDQKTARDPQTGLFYGESSFLDWREQTYPRWMDPKDIYKSQNLGTNAVHYLTYRILEDMAGILGEESAVFGEIARQTKEAINKYMWMENKGFYGQYRYGHAHLSLSPRSETLGEALAVIAGISSTEQAASIFQKMPVIDFGPTCIYPQIPNIPPYHNNGIWPFVAAFWTWAAAENGQSAAVEHGLASIYRPAALFLTNKENFVAGSGDYMGTEINSDRQLWSVAGNLAAVYRVFFGMRFEAGYLEFKPFVPQSYGGARHLRNFSYRNAQLDITVRGYGNRIKSVYLDSEKTGSARISGELAGKHELLIELADNTLPSGPVNIIANRFSPDAPQVELKNKRLSWQVAEGADLYRIYKNGREIGETTATEYSLKMGNEMAEYQVLAAGKDGLESFLSEPRIYIPQGKTITVQAEKTNRPLKKTHKGYSGKGYLELTKIKNKKIIFVIDLPADGIYQVDFCYANGNGPINTNNKCAIRSLYVDGKRAGAIILAQRGNQVWDDWGFSNSLPVELKKGRHHVQLSFEPTDENMNGLVNKAHLDYMRFVLLNGDK